MLRDSFSSINQEYRTRQLGVQVNIPIFSGGYTNAATTQAIANRERARNELEATVNKTHIEVTKQYSGTVSGLAKVQALSQTIEAHYSWMERQLGKGKLRQIYALLDELIALESPDTQTAEELVEKLPEEGE